MAGSAWVRAASGSISRTGLADGPLSDGTGAGAAWAPVPYRRAQLFVPGLWLVESPQQFWCAPWSRGMIFVGIRPGIPKGAGCGLTASLAWILPAGHIPPGIRHRRPTAVIHGIPVYRLPGGPKSVLYPVPDLGVRIGARGPLARRVLATLTGSPLSAVLRCGPAGFASLTLSLNPVHCTLACKVPRIPATAPRLSPPHCHPDRI